MLDNFRKDEAMEMFWRSMMKIGLVEHIIEKGNFSKSRNINVANTDMHEALEVFKDA